MKKIFTLVLMTLSTTLYAEKLQIGLRADVTSIDPHFHVSGPNLAIANHVFEPLIKQDSYQNLIPGLATKWEKINDLTWEMSLREGVKFHNGQIFEAKDVDYTIKRIQKGVGPIQSFKTYIQFIDKVEILDPYKIRIHATQPYPILMSDLAQVLILPHTLGEKVDTNDFNQGKAAFGTGPYRFEKWVPAQEIVFNRNEDYWGENEYWEKVIYKPVPQDFARFNALLAGDLQFIETVPVEELERLKSQSNLKLFAKMPSRLMYLALDIGRSPSPLIKDNNGKIFDKNPFQDQRVREAFSLAINRNFLIQNYLGGLGIPAGQLVLEGGTGFDPDLKPRSQDLQKAKQLLQEAGYPEGFQIDLHTTSGRYVNDVKISQAIAAMLGQIGIKTRVEALPNNIFFSRSQKGDFSISLGGWPVGKESLSPLQALLHSYKPESGQGIFNRGRYNAPELDKIIEEAFKIMDDEKREAMLKEANRHITKNLPLVLLYFSTANWAGENSLTFEPRFDEYTLAMNIRRKS